MSITENEILNQYTTWKKLSDLISPKIKKRVNELDEDYLVIFTGAGTSGYIGDILVNFLNKDLKRPRFFSLYSCSIVGDLSNIINTSQKILLVSFGRSGDSPESIHTIYEINKKVENVKHLVITCNKDGELAKLKNASVIILPDETNDEGFAMTNSFSSMLLTSYLLFGGTLDIENVINESKAMLESFKFEENLNKNFDNVIFLANTNLVAATKEFALKCSELSNGKLAYYNEHILNFRHGPKSVITKPSLIFVFNSIDEKAHKYEDDMIFELINDENKPEIILFGNTNNNKVDTYHFNTNSDFESILITLPIIQLFSVKLSEKLSINPDNPSPSGSVNRVVQGVILYD